MPNFIIIEAFLNGDTEYGIYDYDSNYRKPAIKMNINVNNISSYQEANYRKFNYPKDDLELIGTKIIMNNKQFYIVEMTVREFEKKHNYSLFK